MRRATRYRRFQRIRISSLRPLATSSASFSWDSKCGSKNVRHQLRFVLIFVLTALAAWSTVPRAQMRVVPLDEQQGHVALGLALRHLANTGVFMQATAHPDDEDNGLLVMLNRGQGFRTALATATRGNGG